MISLFTSRWKTGKTTLLSILLQRLRTGERSPGRRSLVAPRLSSPKNRSRCGRPATPASGSEAMCAGVRGPSAAGRRRANGAS
jgi:hypothetical protein